MRVAAAALLSSILIGYLLCDSLFFGETQKDAGLNGVLGNDGAITKMYVCQISDATTSESDLNIIESLQRAGINELCISRFFTCFGDDVTSANVCLPNDYDSLRYLPLAQGSDFQLLKIKQGNQVMRFDTLSLDSKLELLIYLGDSLDAVRWNGSTWENSVIDISPISSDLVLDSVLMKDASELWRSKTTARKKSKRANERTVYIDWKYVCGTADVYACSTDILTYLRQYAQDQYAVREGVSCLRAVNKPWHQHTLQHQRHRYGLQLCGCSDTYSKKNTLEKIPVKGGNYFVRNGIVFMGAEIARCFRRCQNWSSTIGLDEGAQPEQINDSLRHYMVGNNSKAVIWVGHNRPNWNATCNCSGYPYEGTSEQPLYHIDLFFHPFGIKKGTDTLTYILALLNNEWHDESVIQTPQYQRLQKNLKSTDSLLQADILKMNLIPKPIYVPLIYGKRPGKDFYIAFANGHSSATSSGYQYLLPKYLDAYGYARYDEVHRAALDSLSKGGIIDVKEIEEYYGLDNALHCVTKVVSRQGEND